MFKLESTDTEWLGRLQICKPKKGSKVGIPIMPWHHLGLIDDYVIVYIWDTREIIDVFKSVDIKTDFQTVKMQDTGKALFLGTNSTSKAVRIVTELVTKYSDLPISTTKSMQLPLDELREQCDKAIAYTQLLATNHNCIVSEDAVILFWPSDICLPVDKYMFDNMPTFNPEKLKLRDAHSYTGRAKYYAIIARCAIIKNWIETLCK